MLQPKMKFTAFSCYSPNQTFQPTFTKSFYYMVFNMQSSKLNLFQTLLIPTVLRQIIAIYDVVCTLQPKRMIFTVFCKAIAENTGTYNVLTHCMHKIIVNTANCCLALLFRHWEFFQFFWCLWIGRRISKASHVIQRPSSGFSSCAWWEF